MIAAYIPESEVVRRWQRQMDSRRRVVAADGKPLEVLYPGRLNDRRGGDFRDAVILFDNAVSQGCIEIHSRTSGWKAHGHQTDPQYNQVVLHVVWQQDSAGPTRLENGRSIPTIVLDRDLAAMEAEGEVLPCRKIQTAGLGLCLERLGETRLAEKVQEFRSDLLKIEAEQVLYEGILEALGYSQNKRPFLDLARRASLRDLKPLTQNAGDWIRAQSYLLGTAGLLPSQRGIEDCAESYIRELEIGWRENGAAQAMSCREWELFRVRPGNYPVRRIIALAGLLFRFRGYGWLETWRRVLDRAERNDGRVDLRAWLMVKAEGYWTGHYDFNLPHHAGGGWLLGRERASEIIINVILPFFIAWSRLNAEVALADWLKRFYYRFPPCETNAVQKHMLGQLKAQRGLLNSSLRQQGLLHLYKTYCTRGRCVECILNR